MDLVTQYLLDLVHGPVTHSGHLAIVPLLARQGATSPPFYDTLKDALATGAVSITEVSEDGSVPELLVVNAGARPVLLVDGEELVGARQNRIVNITLMVPANSKLRIPVSCVEAGRWSYRSREFVTADRAFHASGRRDKLTQVNLSMRTSASRQADQGAVWAEIASKSARMEAPSPTSAAAAMFEKRHADLERYVSDLTPAASQVGGVFLTRGRVAGMEVFDHPQSWVTQMPMLVRSYGLDSLDDALHGAIDRPAEGPAAAEFVGRISLESAETFAAIGLGTDVRFAADSFVGGGLVVDDALVHLVAVPTGRAAAAAPRDERHPRRARRRDQRVQ